MGCQDVPQKDVVLPVELKNCPYGCVADFKQPQKLSSVKLLFIL